MVWQYLLPYFNVSVILFVLYHIEMAKKELTSLIQSFQAPHSSLKVFSSLGVHNRTLKVYKQHKMLIFLNAILLNM